MDSKIKRMGRKYALSALLAGSIALSGCGKGSDEPVQLPVYTNTKNSMVAPHVEEDNFYVDNLLKSFNTHMEESINSFNVFLKDGVLTRDEQELVYEQLGSANTIAKKINEHTEEYKNGLIKNSEKKLNDLLGENLEGFDFRNPSLENHLIGQGIDVDVQGKRSFIETLMPIMLGLAGYYLYLKCKYDY